ncbi:hypothetical protein BDN72DRAFT_964285 [Pluteus cervinus]|uniref:Uncharacterized protein n=1 Tax=Pluteus cervinus TaxID=181527 RepID=A0ACD3AB79_9AGAR|nr:hypothetical protein BDN72DRAFT_964285 [Pluteus cervinus]
MSSETADAPTPTSSTPASNAQEQTVSPRFAAEDADIILQSSDGVHFKVHRINLKMHSDIFADAEDISSLSSSSSASPSLIHVGSASPAPTHGQDSSTSSTSSSTFKSSAEVVALSESAPVLELLLQYMYRQPPPDLSKVAFELLAGLAEAAEKYRVYYAIDGCRRAMRDSISVDGHAFQVLRWAVKHKHSDLIDEAAEAALSVPVQSLRSVLEPSLYLPWNEYQRSWADALSTEVIRFRPTTNHWNTATRETDMPCEPWTHAFALLMHKLAGKPSQLLKLDEVFKQSEDYLHTRCPECREVLAGWKTAAERDIEKMPKFSKLI